MKVYAFNGKTAVSLSKQDWLGIGVEAGWFKEAQNTEEVPEPGTTEQIIPDKSQYLGEPKPTELAHEGIMGIRLYVVRAMKRNAHLINQFDMVRYYQDKYGAEFTDEGTGFQQRWKQAEITGMPEEEYKNILLEAAKFAQDMPVYILNEPDEFISIFIARSKKGFQIAFGELLKSKGVNK